MNLLFTPTLFRLPSLPLAAADILVVLAKIPWMMAAVSRHHPWVALAPVPYLARVAIATVLQLAITAWNR